MPMLDVVAAVTVAAVATGCVMCLERPLREVRFVRVVCASSLRFVRFSKRLLDVLGLLVVTDAPRS